jgi:DnaJ family protein C protein 28
MRWDRIIEEKIRAAQAEGQFDNLKGKGRPLNLDQNPFEDPAWQMANHLLKEQGFRPEWLEEDVALRKKLSEARQALARTHAWRQTQPAHTAAPEWAKAEARFRQALAEINTGLQRLNLLVPTPRLQRPLLNVDKEFAQVVGAGDEATPK